MDPDRMELFKKINAEVWSNFYESGGWGMYPTTFFGFLLVLTACLYMFRTERRFLPVVLTTGFLTANSGILATLTGLKIGFTYAYYLDPAQAAQIAVRAAASAFSNIVLALILLNLGGIATLVGLIRQARRRTA